MSPGAAWSALTAGVSLLTGATSLAVYAHVGWHPTDPVALAGAFLLGAAAGVVGVAVTADGSTRIDRATGRHEHPEALDLGDVLRISRRDDLMDVADAVREPRGGAQ